jgi:5,10-methylenetetrahydrofolate reductase
MNFKEKLNTKNFIITAELFPPKGTDIAGVMERAEIIAPHVDAVNMTDNQRASMRVGSLAMCKLLKDKGIEPIMQLACRDKNRIALQSDLLSAAVLGIENVLVISGDHTNAAEYKGTPVVYDLDPVRLLGAARLLETGVDLAGKKLSGNPKFCLGAVVNPSANPVELQIEMFKKKVASGAEFFQTQTIFDVETFKNFKNKLPKDNKVKVFAGVTLIKSVKFMRFLQSLPGVTIPETVQKRIMSAQNPLEEGIQICAELIKALRAENAHGAHIMAIGLEQHIPEIIKQSI